MGLDHLPVPELEEASSGNRSTLVSVLRQRAQELGDQRAYVYLADGETETEVWTYADLDRRARALAAALTASDFEVAGRPVLVCAPPGLDYIAGFFCCLYAGAIAVPANPPDPLRLDRTLPRFKAILEDAGAVAALSTREQIEAAREVIESDLDLPISRWLAIDEHTEDDEAFVDPKLQAGDPAFLMYTSGSTAAPKGVVIGHGNAVHNLSRFPGFVGRPCTAFVSWLPFFHDLGLFMGMLHPLYRACPSILMPPAAFVKRPVNWLAALSRYQATTTGGPNFAFDLCSERVSAEELEDLDLSSWNLALNGAEPVRWRTLERFGEVFGPCGFNPATFYPSFGLAEGAATVTGATDFERPLILRLEGEALGERRVAITEDENAGRTYVGCGPTIAEQRVEIIDPETRRPVGADCIGEVWVAGPSIGQAYWRQPESTARGLTARLADEPNGPIFLRTGDLGFIHRNELFLTGRLKDLIILHGVNHHPEDLEETIGQAHPKIRANCGAAFAIEEQDREGLAIVQEVDPRGLEAFDEVIDSLRQALVSGHDIDPETVVLIPPRRLPKTSSGKVQRHETARRFTAGDLATLAVWRRGRSAKEQPEASSLSDLPNIRQRLVEHIAKRADLEIERVDIRAPFSRFGLASLESLDLVRELESWLGLKLEPTLAWEYPTIEQMADHLDARLRRRPILQESTRSAPQQEPIAIVGMSCRYPGANSPQELWEMLCSGRDAISEVPENRWDVNQLFDPDPDAAGKMISRHGGFVPGLEKFDAAFFGITPREAVHLDPRQRLLLETTWEALEDARIPPDSLAGTRTGVFIAALTNDYDHLLCNDLRRISAYTGPGTAETILANRLSYVFDLIGPSMTLNTACSGSLVAIHLACQSLHSGESEIALAGGVNLILMPKGTIFFSKAGALAPDGHCKTFDVSADGIVRSDGSGMLVLKPLSKALADNDPIYAVIRGSATNSDGRSNGIMAPNGRSQELLLREAYARAGVDPKEVEFVEAHGTGTSVGDPIEMNALGKVLGNGRDDDHRCRVGSIKTQIGHMEAASGVAGLMKVALSLHHSMMPPNLHFSEENPLIPFGELGLQVQTSLEPWQRNGHPRRAGISAFGFGGTNAHLVIEEAPRREVVRRGTDSTKIGILPLSARSQPALEQLLEAYGPFLTDSEDPRSICRSAALGRTHHEVRAALIGTNPSEFADLIVARQSGQSRDALATGKKRGSEPKKVAFVFSGQGSHWLGMGRELLEQEPVFRQAVEQCDVLFDQGWNGQSLDRSLIDLLRDDDADALNRTDATQPTVFAVQVGLAALWRSWGIEPSLCLGQSLGEAAAAHVAGALSLEDAARVVFFRSQLMQRVEGQGATAVVGLPRAEAELAVLGFADRLGVAGSNSPTSSVLAGDPEALDTLLGGLASRDVFTRRLAGVRVAFHSPQMDPLVEELVASLEGLSARTCGVPFLSSVTGMVIDGQELDAGYWGRHLRQPFLFTDAMEQAIADGHDLFLEVAPHPVLASPILESLRAAEREGRVLPSIKRNQAERHQLYCSLGELYCAGVDIDWGAVYPEADRPSTLPFYPFQRQPYWYDQLGHQAKVTRSSERRAGDHPLLGQLVQLATRPPQHLWEMDLEVDENHFLADHVIQGAVVFPGAAFLEMAMGAIRQRPDSASGSWGIVDVRFERALILPAQPRRIQLLMTDQSEDTATFQIASRSIPGEIEEPWTVHVRGSLRRSEGEAPSVHGIDDIRERCSEEILVDEHYRSLDEREMHFGPDFRPLQGIWRRDDEALGHMRLSEEAAEVVGYRVHPVLLDALFQLTSAALPQGGDDDPYLPAGLESLRLHKKPGNEVWGHVELLPKSEGDEAAGNAGRIADVRLLDAEGQVTLEVLGLRFQRLGGTEQPRQAEDLLHQLAWNAAAEVVPAASEEGASWLIFTDSTLGEEVAMELEESGELAVLVEPGEAFEEVDAEERYRVRPGSSEDLDELLKQLADSTLPDLRGVLYLWAFDQPAFNGMAEGESAVNVSRDRIWATPFALAQSLARLDWRTRPRLWFATQGAQSVIPGETQAIESSALWGFGRAIAREHAECWGGLIDLPTASTPAAAAYLRSELLAADGEDQVSYRDGIRYVARLQPAPRTSLEGAITPRPDAAYLITGGFGGLGLETARLLAERGARRLILVSRRPMPERQAWLESDDPRIEAVRELEALGANVEAVALDIADADATARFFAEYRREGRPPIRGVVHSAGVLRDALMSQLSFEDVATVLAPKVAGAWNLHRFAETDPEAAEPLDFFVLFSSAASLLPPLGQAAYAAGNAFLDALARHRRAEGRAGSSLGWGPWAEIGMAARADLDEQHRSSGVKALRVEHGLKILEAAMADGSSPESPFVAPLVMDADWSSVLRNGGPQRFLEHFDRPQEVGNEAESTGPSEAANAFIFELLLQPDQPSRQALLAERLRERTASVMRLDPEQLDPDRSLMNLGMDSIMAVELSRQVETDLGLKLTLMDLLKGVSIHQLAEQMLEQSAENSEFQAVAAILNEVEQLDGAEGAMGEMV